MNQQTSGHPRPALTDRQTACLEGVAQHKTAKLIAKELGISYHAVESHLKAARRKLGASSTAEALELLNHGPRPYYGEPPSQRPTDAEQYYGSTGLSGASSVPHPGQAGRLDEAVFAGLAGRRKRVWEYDFELTPQRSAIFIGVAAIGFIAALALLIAIGTGVNMLVLAQS